MRPWYFCQNQKLALWHENSLNYQLYLDFTIFPPVLVFPSVIQYRIPHCILFPSVLCALSLFYFAPTFPSSDHIFFFPFQFSFLSSSHHFILFNCFLPNWFNHKQEIFCRVWNKLEKFLRGLEKSCFMWSCCYCFIVINWGGEGGKWASNL